jgi:hypothetical protein
MVSAQAGLREVRQLDIRDARFVLDQQHEWSSHHGSVRYKVCILAASLVNIKSFQQQQLL